MPPTDSEFFRILLEAQAYNVVVLSWFMIGRLVPEGARRQTEQADLFG